MKKVQWVLLAVTAGFLCVLLGMFIGRNTKGAYLQLPTLFDTTQATDPSSDSTSVSTGKLDINKADAEQLAMLPGIGDILAKRIVDYRNEHGPFTSFDALLNIEDIGNRRLEKILDYITIGE